jgi:hypothetical protein
MHVALADIRALEEALHRTDVRGSRTAVEALLADGFVEFGVRAQSMTARRSSGFSPPKPTRRPKAGCAPSIMR